MILLASGHPGVQEFGRQRALAGMKIVVADTWAQAESHLPRADKILVGQRLSDFPDAIDWARNRMPAGIECVLWVEPAATAVDELAGIPRLRVWRGEIDRMTLDAWWSHGTSELAEFARQWAVISLWPYANPAPLIQYLTNRAQGEFGSGGGWIDLDWQRAELSLAVWDSVYDRTDYPFGSLRARRAREGQIIPAPPPWVPGTRPPTLDQITSLLKLPWPWQGWYLGADLAGAAAVAVLRQVALVVLWQETQTASDVTRRTEEYVRLLGSQPRFWVVDRDQLDFRMDGSKPGPTSEGLARRVAKILGHGRSKK